MGTAWLEHRTDGSLGAGGVHEPPHQAIRILLVEDNPGDARLFYEALKETHSCAFDLVHVERLSSAMDWLTQGRADIILLDLSLPDSHGFETFTKMRACVPGIPLVVLTGLDDETMAVRAVREGAQDYLVKGRVDGSILVRSMRYAIERGRLIAELQDALGKVRTLSGLLPICACCKKIRDDKGYWNQIESYIQKHSDAEFSHGICPDCFKALYPEIDIDVDRLPVETGATPRAT